MIIVSSANWENTTPWRIEHSESRRLAFLSAWERVKSWHAATDSPLCSTYQYTSTSTAKLKVRSQTQESFWVLKKHSTLAVKQRAVRVMSEAGLVSPATWRKTLSRFLWMIRRRRAQTDSKDFPYLLLHSICGESGFDRLMRVRSVFSTCSLSLILSSLQTLLTNVQ